MASVYFYLVLLAAIFTLLGFFVHAFYFSGSRVEELSKETDGLRHSLIDKQREVREAQEEISKASNVVRSLEQQIRQRNDEMQQLQALAVRQEEQISALQKDAQALRSAVASAPPPPRTPETPPVFADAHPPAPAFQKPAEPQAIPPEHSVPPRASAAAAAGARPAPWRENLSQILDVLDTMEKEVES